MGLATSAVAVDAGNRKKFRSGWPPAAAIGAQPPVEHHERAAEHAAEVREMRDARLSAGDAEEELEYRVAADEQPRGHGDGKIKQQPGAGEEQREGEQNPEYPARGADGGLAGAHG